jgi:MFS family permease
VTVAGLQAKTRTTGTHPPGQWNLIVLGLVGFVTSFGAHAVAVNLPTYASTVGVGTFVIGVLIAVYDFAEVVAKPLFGFVADRRGQVITLWLGLLVFSVASGAFLLVDPRLLILIRLLQGLGAAAFSVISVALVASYFPQRRAGAIGTYNALKGAGYVLGPVIGGFIVADWGFRGLFVVTLAVGVAVLLLSLRLPEPEEPEELEDDDEFSFTAFLAPFKDRRLLPWFAIIVINMFFVGILFGFVPVLLKHLGYGPRASGLIVGAGSAAYILVQPVAGWLADRFGTRRTILVGLLASSVALILLPFASEIPFIALVILGGLGIGVVWTNCDAMISELAQEGQMAASLGAAGSYKEIGDMLGPLTIGGIAQAAGVSAGFVTCGLLGLAGSGAVFKRAGPGLPPVRPAEPAMPARE